MSPGDGLLRASSNLRGHRVGAACVCAQSKDAGVDHRRLDVGVGKELQKGTYFERTDGKSVLSKTPTNAITLHSSATASRRTVRRFGNFAPDSIALTCGWGSPTRSASSC